MEAVRIGDPDCVALTIPLGWDFRYIGVLGSDWKM